MRNQGYYLYNNVDKGKYIPGSLSTTTPNSNSSVGGAYFELDGHEMFLYTSGSNYNGGFSIRDMSAEATAVATIPPMGSGGYSANPSVGSFFRVVPERGKSVIVYEYTMGNGYAAYRVHTTDYTAIENINGDTLRTDDNSYYDLSGRKINNNNLPAGIYIHNSKKVIVR